MKNFISLGAGVQSSTMALMAAAGEIGPMPDAAIFADTQAEPASVYVWLDWLEGMLPFPVIRVTKGSLTEAALRMRERTHSVGGPYTKSLIPVYTIDGAGKKGHMARACTVDYKLRPLIAKQKELAGASRREKRLLAYSWIGISTDEITRMKETGLAWITNRFPLIEMGMDRQDCIAWMESKGFPRPPRSACVYCPYHSDKEWARLKADEPDEFERAAAFESELQRTKAATDNMRSVPYLHASRTPIRLVDFEAAGDVGYTRWDEECLGMCGV